jgi:transglutaminase-like putative cysteine protease
LDRRDFLTLCGMGYALYQPNFLSAKDEIQFGQRSFSLAFDFDLSHIKHSGVSLWVPLPTSNDFQQISDFQTTSASVKSSINNNNSYDASLLYIKWEKDEDKKISLKFNAKTRPFKLDFNPKKTSSEALKYASRFVQPTRHVQTDGIVLEISNKIASPHKSNISKAHAIYDWVVENMYRDPDVKGCGAGNAKEALEQKRFGGKCLDISAVFVALLRAQNIPARELMGIRVGSSAISPAFGVGQDISSAQHCRAEFFVEDLGWIRADPADITKLRLQEKLVKNSDREKQIADSYFGSFEMNWLKFNHARDFELYPRPVQFPLDQFNYPYAEADDEVLDFYDAKSFKYKITSIESS